ncbi:MAG TPA: hydrogenase maturation protease [Flavilitoribacter sp.]|nr:hydrogenase maturation protease [Flavilitoribacter sp.]
MKNSNRPSTESDKTSILSAIASSKGGPLLIAIGNDLRGDDGLGWALLEKLEQENPFTAETAYRYQLQVEDAGLIAGFDAVVFIDASKEPAEEGYVLAPCLPAAAFEFTTHMLNPGSVLYLCRELYGRSPKAFTLGISGAFWGLKRGLSKTAQGNLETAYNGLRQALNSI